MYKNIYKAIRVLLLDSCHLAAKEDPLTVLKIPKALSGGLPDTGTFNHLSSGEETPALMVLPEKAVHRCDRGSWT